MNINHKKKPQLKSQKSIQKIQSNKLLYTAPFIWKRIFLIKASFVFKLAEKLIYTRASNIPQTFLNSYTTIYSGKKWQEKVINKWMVGFKFGEFTWNRKIALYRAKQLKKKKKKK